LLWFLAGPNQSWRQGKIKEKESEVKEMKRKLLIAIALAGVMMFSQRAEAIPSISGELHMFGVGEGSSVPSTATAFLDFPLVITATRSGDFSAVPFGTVVTMQPFAFAAALSPDPVAPLWTFTIGATTYSFDLSSINIEKQSLAGLVLSGTGIAKITGFAPTPGLWSLTTQGSLTEFAFSSSTIVRGVPDGGSTLLLLGGVLTALAFFGRRTAMA
jgi:hypothetical protein